MNPRRNSGPTREYCPNIIEAIETAFKFAGNVVNTGGKIKNLPEKACVEIPCVADRSGITPCYVGEIPRPLAALNRTNINTQLLTIEAAVTKMRDAIYPVALFDPHTSAELSIDEIIAMCDDLIEVHGDWLPLFLKGVADPLTPYREGLR